MAATPSTMLALGTPLPEFELHEVQSNKLIKSQNFEGRKAYVIAFICNHCPYVLHILDELTLFIRDFDSEDVAIFLISSNDVKSYPQDGPTKMAELGQTQKWSVPYLYDEDQSVAKAFHAACTPDFFVFDHERKLAYRGQFDDSRPSNGKKASGKDLRDAVSALLMGERPSSNQKASLGCNIKWK